MSLFPLPPGATIGILGGGQLGRMLAMAAARLGFDVAVLSPQPDSPAARVAAREIVGAYDDPTALAELARLADVVTYEFENVPAIAVERLLSAGAEVAPGPKALATAQDRIAEKTFVNEAGAATVAFLEVNTADDLAAALAWLGAPLLLKTRRGGYDGKGQAWVRRAEEAETVFAGLGGRPCIAEAPAGFRRELAIIGARGRDGGMAFYPLTESWHEAGILRRTIAPAAASPALAAAAERIAGALLERLDYVGVIGVELFETDDGALLVNEFAPRVHNTGHWTMDGCPVDQFEQHVRAVAGWPLGPTEARSRVEMTNLLGDEAARWPLLARDPGARVWLYGKAQARPGRKMGHVNRLN